MRTPGAGLLLSLFIVVPVAYGDKPDGVGTGKPGGGGKTPPNPDIVYMSVGNMSLAGPSIRGVTIAADASASTDAPLLKANSGRSRGSIAWSPDGTRFAWIENGVIMTAAPGGKPAQLYPTGVDDPRPEEGSDALAWGPACPGTEGSIIAFRAISPANSIQVLEIGAGGVSGRRILVEFPTHCDQDTDGMTCTMAGAGALAFSPQGRLLAFHGFADDMPPGIWAAPVCEDNGVPGMILANASVGSTDPFAPVLSMDWSPDGGRLALSVTVGPDRAYPWRDLKVAYLDYSFDGAEESVNLDQLRTINLDGVFGSASSEHSPQWGPAAGIGGCQRIAFSQSAGASDGSDMNGRRLFLLDVPEPASSGTCPLGSPLDISARNPRAIDWK